MSRGNLGSFYDRRMLGKLCAERSHVSILCFGEQSDNSVDIERVVLTGEGWQVISIARRFQSLPEKFNALAGLARGEILLVWEDDDIYLPHHIGSHVAAMDGHLWSKPSKVLSDYTGQIQEEDATGRFHASIAMTRQAFEECGGWPLTLRGDFDQQLIAILKNIGLPGDPCQLAAPAYVFRWGSTGAYHGQALMRGPDDEQWYNASALSTINALPLSVEARMDLGTQAAFDAKQSSGDRRPLMMLSTARNIDSFTRA